ncbi:hypothetical protein J2T16_003045 [Paenibacillus intestini]|uniref:hypothetical protein n=1 Tax=Paenibacillus polysaccharolyticus TaxID=582692 RepID=UPI0029591752|nr:hypothetical protein [Paenibacillus intestini]
MKKKRLVYSRFQQSDQAVLGREAHYLNESYEESVRDMVVPNRLFFFYFPQK